jgi:hypothetical protein
MSDGLNELILKFMFWCLLPLWVIAGAADYSLHRRTSIETTSGFTESMFHVVQAAQIAVILFLGLFLESTTLVLCLMALMAIAHTLTGIWDSSYSTPRRYISALEQHVHSHLEYIPLIAVSLTVLLYWNRPFDLSLRWRDPGVQRPYLLGVLIPVFIVQGILLGEESLRTWRHRIPR